jgi:hypothetical protein
METARRMGMGSRKGEVGRERVVGESGWAFFCENDKREQEVARTETGWGVEEGGGGEAYDSSIG